MNYGCVVHGQMCTWTYLNMDTWYYMISVNIGAYSFEAARIGYNCQAHQQEDIIIGEIKGASPLCSD